MLIRALKNAVRSHAQRHAPVSSGLAYLSALYLRCYRNQDYEIARNGERLVLERLREFRPKQVIDVGAHLGDWSATARHLLPEATIDAFEIAAITADSLERRFADEPRVRVHRFGLADTSGTTEIVYMGGDHSGTSLLKPERVRVDVSCERQEARTETGDEFCSREGIEQIDFLKVDAEGADLRVLQGFERTFSGGRVRLCQFEYNTRCIESRCLLADFYEFFEARGYVVGKLWARGVSFGPYEFREENFRGPNYLAVHESESRLREALHYAPRGFR